MSIGLDNCDADKFSSDFLYILEITMMYDSSDLMTDSGWKRKWFEKNVQGIEDFEAFKIFLFFRWWKPIQSENESEKIKSKVRK